MRVILEVRDDGSKPKAIAENIRSDADGILLAEAMNLLEISQGAVKAYEWMMSNVNLAAIPDELRPLQAKLLKARRTVTTCAPSSTK
jgi:hypothetical protein